MSFSILIVDDNKTDRYIIKRRLKKISNQVTVMEAVNGQEALEFFENHEEKRRADPVRYPPLFIFLDINMPILDGFGFLDGFEHLRLDQFLNTVVVVMFTSSPRQEDMDRSFAYGSVKDFVIKGDFSTEVLERLFAKHMDKHRYEQIIRAA